MKKKLSFFLLGLILFSAKGNVASAETSFEAATYSILAEKIKSDIFNLFEKPNSKEPILAMAGSESKTFHGNSSRIGSLAIEQIVKIKSITIPQK